MRTRSDSATAAVRAAQNVAEGPLKPPRHVKIPARARPYWLAVMQSRPRHRWTEADLVNAGILARAMADVEQLSRELDEEAVTIGDKLNPKFTAVEKLSRRIMSLSRLLHVHPEATQGRAREQGNTLQAEREAARVAEDPLIPTLRKVG
jgi:hypothetical protein